MPAELFQGARVGYGMAFVPLRRRAAADHEDEREMKVLNKVSQVTVFFWIIKVLDRDGRRDCGGSF
jgi:hypothetical protein